MHGDHKLVPNHDGEEDDLDVSYRAHAGHPGVDDDYVRTGLGGLDDDPEMNGGDMSRYDPSTMTRLADGVGGGGEMHPHDYSGAGPPPPPTGGKWRKFVLIGVALCTIVGSIAILAARKTSSATTDGVVGGGGGGGGNDDLSSSLQPPPPPANLADVCNVQIIGQSTKLFEKCEEYCEVAVCCTEPVTHPFSCLLGNEEVCDLYNDSCEHLYRLKDNGGGGGGGGADDATSTTSLPKAPLSLANMCTADNIASSVEGLAECEDACLPAQCCFATTSPSCRESLQEDCQTYQDCSILYDNDTDKENPPTDVDDTGDDATDGTENEDNDDQDGSTGDGDGEDDGQDDANDGDNENQDQDAPDGDDDQGDTDGGEAGNDQEGVDDDQDDDKDDEEDGDDNDDENLFDDDDDDDDVDADDDDDDVDADDDDENLFDDDDDDGGLFDDDDDDGGLFDDDDDGTIDNDDSAALETQVNQLCSETAIATEEGKDACKQKCDVAICCFLQQGAAHGLDPSLRAPCGIEPESQAWCAQYNGCLILIAGNHWTDTEVANGVDGGGGGGGSNDNSNVGIATACAPSAIATAQGHDDCRSKCLPGKCCFVMGDDNNDENDNDDEGEEGEGETCAVDCSLYDVCATIFDDADDPDVDGSGTTPSLDESHSMGEENQTPPSVSTQKKEIDLVCETVVSSPETQEEASINSACLALCRPGACCFDNISGCDNNDSVDCYDYMGCYTMYQSDNANSDDEDDDISAAKVVVDTVCHEDSLDQVGGSAACETVCAHGACCFQSDEDTCFQWGVNVKCHDYMACSVLHAKAGEAASSSSTTKTAIAQACSTDNLAHPGGRDECEGLCSPSECCYSPTGDSCLVAGVDVNCHDFMDCIILHPTGQGGGGGGGDTSKQQDVQSQRKKIVDSVCSEEGRAIPDGTKACEALCESATCCYDNANSGDCAADCFEFTGCYPVFAKGNSNDKSYDDDSSSITAQDIAMACSADSLKSSTGIDECTALCSSAECCFQNGDGGAGDEDSCLDKGKDVDCNKFSSCQAVFSSGLGEEGNDDNNDATTTPTSSTDLRRAIDQACDASNVQTATGKAECDKLCMLGSCCHDDSPDNICDASVDCYSYFGCPVSSAGNTNDDGDDDDDNGDQVTSTFRTFVDSSCSEVALASPGGHDACEAACAPGACCFNAHQGNCFEANSQVNCLDYGTCVKAGILEPLVPTPSDPMVTMIDTKCTAEALSNGGRAECESLCEDSDCCFQGGSNSCAVAGVNVDCHLYQACSILHEEASTSKEEKKKKNHDLRSVITAACTEESVTMPGRPSACEMFCEKGACCFDDDNAKCQQDDVDCYDYMECRDVYKGADNR